MCALDKVIDREREIEREGECACVRLTECQREREIEREGEC